jgi:hypothetical protein
MAQQISWALFQKDRSAKVVLNFMKASLARKKIFTFHLQSRSVRQIQNSWRYFSFRRSKMVVLIQSQYRCYKAKLKKANATTKEVQILFFGFFFALKLRCNAERGMALRMQCMVRRWFSLRLASSRKQAALVLQSHGSRWFTERNASSAIIQRHVIVFLLRKRQKNRERAQREARRVLRDKQRNSHCTPWGSACEMRKKLPRRKRQPTSQAKLSTQSTTSIEANISSEKLTTTALRNVSGNKLSLRPRSAHNSMNNIAAVGQKENPPKKVQRPQSAHAFSISAPARTEGDMQSINAQMLAKMVANKKRNVCKAGPENRDEHVRVPLHPRHRQWKRKDSCPKTIWGARNETEVQKDIGPGWNDRMNANEFSARGESKRKVNKPQSKKSSKIRQKKQKAVASASHKLVPPSSSKFVHENPRNLTAETISDLWKEFLETHNYDAGDVSEF